MRNKWLWGIMLLSLAVCACDDEKTYEDMKKAERAAVGAYISEMGINIIPFSEFIVDSVTDVANNEYVLIDDVYMQIERNPKGLEDARQMKDGETLTLLVRFSEYNISEGDTILGNIYDSDNPDVMRVTYEDGSYSATFTSGYMYSYYGSYVPTGWLTALPYIYMTRRQSQVAKVNLIVPHTKGTSQAASYVYPCSYNITFTPERLYDTD
ncbi:MAG: DUF4827 domain-containing protein [Bacteroidaceae bacterium]|nr:DUF4827 domain-containing protein [Bacteroidales bacterium]MBQ3188587.1 DUF4827 domain-containing protein [Bacteroidaceae bacterium]MBQ3622527.1 DUF4827 domain-containing protein [Bacteroidaceae bacterium]